MLNCVKKLLKEVINFEQLKDELAIKHNLNIEEKVMGKQKVIFVTRKIGVTSKSCICDESTMLIISDKLEIISTATNKLYPISDLTNRIKYQLVEDGPVYIEQFLHGNRVIITTHDYNNLLSTEQDMFGHNIIPGRNVSYSYFVTNTLNKVLPYNGINELNKLYPNLIWEFIVVPEIDNLSWNKINHKLLLVNCIDKITLTPLDKDELSTIGNKIRIPMPWFRKITHINELNNVIGNFITNCMDMRGVIVSNNKGRFRGKKEIDKSEHSRYLKEYKKDLLLKIIEKILIGDRGQAFNLFPDFNNITLTICILLDKYIKEVNDLLPEYNKIRTKRQLAEKVKNHPLARMFFALREGYTINSNNMIDVLNPKNLLEMIEDKDEDEFLNSIDMCKESLCQKEK